MNYRFKRTFSAPHPPHTPVFLGTSCFFKIRYNMKPIQISEKNQLDSDSDSELYSWFFSPPRDISEQRMNISWVCFLPSMPLTQCWHDFIRCKIQKTKRITLNLIRIHPKIQKSFPCFPSRFLNSEWMFYQNIFHPSASVCLTLCSVKPHQNSKQTERITSQIQPTGD